MKIKKFWPRGGHTLRPENPLLFWGFLLTLTRVSILALKIQVEAQNRDINEPRKGINERAAIEIDEFI